MIARLVRKQEESLGVMSFYFQPENETVWLAGQYAVYRLVHDNPDQKGVQRFFTISTAPFEKLICITMRLTDSTFKQALRKLEVDAEIEVVRIGGTLF